MSQLTKIISAFVWLIFTGVTHAELPDRIVNFEQDLKKFSGAQRIKPLSELAKYYSSENAEKSLVLGREALTLLEQHPDSARKIFVYHYLVMANLNLADYARVEQLLPEYQTFTQKHGDFDEIAMSKKDTAYLYLRRDSNYTLAIEYFLDALKDYRKMPPETENIHFAIGGTLNDLGLMHYYQERFEQALDYYLQTLAIDGYDTSIYSIRTLGNVALIHKQYKRYQQALSYYQKALNNAKKHKRPSRIIEQLINLSATYIFTKEFELALDHLKEAQQLQKTVGRKRSDYRIAKYFGEIYRHQADYQSATRYYQQALTYAEQMQTPRYIAETQIALGNMYLQQAQYQQALNYFQQALATAQTLAFESMIINSHQLLADTYQQLGQYKNAYQHLVSYQKLNQQRFEQDRLEKLANLEEQYKADQREAEIALLTKDKALESLQFKQQRYLYFSIFAVVIIVISLFTYRQQQKRKLANQKATMMADMVEKKNQLLADVSHELRTPLTVLQLKVEALQHNLVQDVEASYDALMTKISDINHLISDIYQLAQSDIGALYLELSQHNINQTLGHWLDEFSLTVEGQGYRWQQNIDQLPELTIAFDNNKIKQVLSNLINNSISYTDTPGTISFAAFIDNQWLNLVVEDSAPGVTTNEMTKIFERLYRVEGSRSRATGGSGLGLAICQSIVEAHNGTIEAANSQLGGLAITIKLPLTQD